jgi:ATP synthase protein I
VPSFDVLMLRRAAVATLAVGVIATIIGTVVAGSKGLIAGVLGTVIVIVFFTAGQALLSRVLKNHPESALMVAMGIYLGKIAVLLVLLLVLQDATFFAPKVFAATIVAGTLAWTFVELWAYSHTQVLYVEPTPSAGAEDHDEKARS